LTFGKAEMNCRTCEGVKFGGRVKYPGKSRTAESGR